MEYPKSTKKFTQLQPVRPIVSHSNSLLSPSAHFIDHMLQPLAQSYPDYLHNSTSLLSIIQNLHIPEEAILVSADVESLYPSIPQSECLETVYQEMYARNHLLLSDPNLIIRLLHTNVNYNFFEFGTFYFQQIHGTAMGAAFSPTIANIFLSVTLQKFLQTQHLKPLLFKRYIDDIFMIWPHSSANLKIFLAALNLSHPSLHYTYATSPSSIDFLDITIFKGLTFDYTGILDTKTY